MSVGAEDYRAALRRHPAGVVIITLSSPTRPVGFTATSFTSLSLDPPLVCFNITNTSSSVEALRRAQSIVIHLLGEHQIETAQRFSRSAEHRFADAALWTSVDTGEPLLAHTPTWLRAEIQQFVDAGDSTLVIARVTHIHLDDTDATPAPLLYHNGGYRRAKALQP
jgi:flavin reductase (DIM6/NTAB) family NADH-FMN oxidoreductase RutF